MAGQFWQDPMFQMGVGLLSGNQGVTGDQAFRNALGSGMSGVLRGQTIVSDIQQREQQKKLMALQQQQLQRQIEQQQRLAAEAPQLSAALLSGDPAQQQQATEGIMSLSPELLPQMLVAQAKAQMPGATQKNFAWFQSLDPSQQDAYLNYQRSMSPFAGMADFLSPVGTKATHWRGPEGQTADPAKTPKQLVDAGFKPTTKPTEKQQDVAAYLANAEAASAIMTEIEGWSPTGVAAASNPVTRLITPEANKRMYDAQLAWTWAVLRAESGATVTREEAANQINIFFERPGDSEKVKQDKARLRATKEQSMKRRAGTAAPTPTGQPGGTFLGFE